MTPARSDPPGALAVVSPVTRANERVSIYTVCALLGVPAHGGQRRSTKTYCPFGRLHHSDGGVAASLRVYPESNSAYCFAGCGYFTPVRLFAHAHDLDAHEAAARLLEHAGIPDPDPYTRWEQLRAARHPPVQAAQLALALRIYCRRVCPAWVQRQFDPPVAGALSRCLALLGHVGDPGSAARWLAGCKTVMSRILADQPVDGCPVVPVPWGTSEGDSG